MFSLLANSPDTVHVIFSSEHAENWLFNDIKKA